MIIFSERCVNFSYSTVLLLTSKYYLKKKRVRSSVKKAANIFIITAILMVATMSQIHLWKCLINGDLLLSPGCPTEQVSDSCCESQNLHESLFEEIDCCQKIHSAVDLNLDLIQSSLSANEKQVSTNHHFSLAQNSALFLHNHHINHFNNLPPPKIPLRQTTPIHITICSFLC